MEEYVISDYMDPTSDIRRNITAGATNGMRWDSISMNDCYTEYANCDGLSTHRDVIVVVDQPDGWIRDDVWHLPSNLAER
jgi:hypothetical protein